MQHQNQVESGEKNTAVLLNKEIVLPTTDNGLRRASALAPS
jgi:hypothetical protein